MKTLLLFTLLAFTSCKSDGIATERTQNPDIKLVLLFEVDGCKVYRFYDGQAVYFTTCSGKVAYDYTTGSTKSRTTHHVESLTERKD